jgi:peroxin-19
MTSKEEQEEIDLILDAALDELDDDDGEEEPSQFLKELSTTEPDAANDDAVDTGTTTVTTEKSSPSKSQEPKQNNKKARPVMGPPRPPVADEKGAEKMITDMMQEMLRMEHQSGDAPDEFLGQLMQGLQSQLASEPPSLDGTPIKQQRDARPEKLKEKGSSLSIEGGVDEAISSLLEGMASEKLNDDLNADAMIDGMMEQLMSRDLMYEPIKQFATSFPPWLEERRDTMSEEDYSKYVF